MNLEIGLKEIRQKNDYFKKMNEILYVFNAADKLHWPFISKIGVQKLIYLSEVLSPLKEVVLSFLNFIYEKRGPYSADIQNTLDYLAALDAVEVVSFEQYGKCSFVNYRITQAGEEIVANLVLDIKEKDKLDWIIIVLKIVDAYKDVYSIGKKFKNVDKIVDLVYQEPSFKEIQARGRGEFIPIDQENNPTSKLIKFLRKIELGENEGLSEKTRTEDLEKILLMFFEYLYIHFLNKN